MWETAFVNYIVFLFKMITVIVGVLVLLGSLIKSKKIEKSGEIEITNLSEKLSDRKGNLTLDMLGKKERKKWKKDARKQEKQDSSRKDDKARLFVVTFDGDAFANAVDALREEVTAILMIAREHDKVLLKLESPGGIVHGYGLAASQLQRLKDQGIHLTIAVDKVAASGGYMMACVADRIIAAPFSIVGSIGVVAQVPNIHRLLKKHNIDVDVMTAGKYKRTVTVVGENTEEGRQKFQEELHETHELFKKFVQQNRPQLDIEQIATGEHWYGQQALDLQLIDAIATSDDFILKAIQDNDVFQMDYIEKEKLLQRIGLQVEQSMENIVTKLFNKRTKIM